MKFIAFEKDLDSGKDFQPYLRNEAGKVWDLYRSGIIREIYFTKETHCAVIILECTDKSHAEEVLSSLPLVFEGLIEFELNELLPYDGFSRLFDNSG